MRVTTSNGPETFLAVGNKIQQRDRTTGAITASARVDRAIQFQAGLYEVTEYVLSEVFGTFNPPQRLEFEIELEDGTTKLIEENIFTMVISVDVTNGGTGYVEGEVVRMINASGDVGIGALGVIDRVDGNTGAVLRVAIRDPGTNYLIPPFADFTESAAGVGASGDVNLGPIFTADGFFGNNDGKLSTNKVLQDNFFYQDYSYVLKTEVTIDKWIDTVKRVIHPAGLKVFGEVTIFRCVETEADHETRFQAYEIPLIGHYTPYTWLTTEDLRAATVADLDLYPDGFDPNALQGSNPLTPTVAEDGTDGPHIPGTNTDAAGDFTDFPDLLARPTLAFGSGSGPFWYTLTSVTGGPFLSGEAILGGTPIANAYVYTVAPTGITIGLVLTDGEFQIGDTITGGTSGATATLSVLLTQPEPKWGFPFRPKADPIFIIYHHPNRRGLVEIPGPGGPHPNPNMRVIDRTMISGAFTTAETLIGDLTRITDITRYVVGDDFTLGETVTGQTSAATAVVLEWNPVTVLVTFTDSSLYVSAEDFTVGETVTGGTSGKTATVVSWAPAAVGSPGSILIVSDISGTFTVGETVTGGASGFTLTLATAEGGLGSELVLGQIASGPFSDGEDIVGNTSSAEITVDEITEDLREGVVDADDLPNVGESQIIMFSGGEFSPGEFMIGQTSGAVALVLSLSSLIYPDGMPFRDIVVRDFARNMRVAEGVLCFPRAEQVIFSDAGYPNEDIGGLDGSGPSE